MKALAFKPLSLGPSLWKERTGSYELKCHIWTDTHTHTPQLKENKGHLSPSTNTARMCHVSAPILWPHPAQDADGSGGLDGSGRSLYFKLWWPIVPLPPYLYIGVWASVFIGFRVLGYSHLWGTIILPNTQLRQMQQKEAWRERKGLSGLDQVGLRPCSVLLTNWKSNWGHLKEDFEQCWAYKLILKILPRCCMANTLELRKEQKQETPSWASADTSKNWWPFVPQW